MLPLITFVLAASPIGPLPVTGLVPVPIRENLCSLHYRISTSSPDCQAHCDQALGYFYSYVWIEAARSFETAIYYDPDCAFAWLGLSRALEEWKKAPLPKADPLMALTGGAIHPTLSDRLTKSPRDYALEMAKKLLPKASHRESLLINAKIQERSQPAAEAKKKAIAVLDELLTLYDDDEEGWFARAKLAEGPNATVPFYRSLLKLNPLHPGANHELVHFFEGSKRPALGWPHALKYIESSPGIPHALHMQAHLATRIGKWDNTCNWSWKAIELERAYHAANNVKPSEDHQYSHHLETLTRSLVHDGRFREAKEIRKEAEKNKYAYRPEWIRMAIALEDWKDASELIAELRKNDKPAAAYFAALVALARGEQDKVKAEYDVLRQARSGRGVETRQWEVQGRMLCAKGDRDEGLKLLKRAVDKLKDDYQHHAWGNGATLMEAWGETALTCGATVDAEEAFQEALAHDAGSVRGALGLWALCDAQDRKEEAARYLKLARKCWSRADGEDFERLKKSFVAKCSKLDYGDCNRK